MVEIRTGLATPGQKFLQQMEVCHLMEWEATTVAVVRVVEAVAKLIKRVLHLGHPVRFLTIQLDPMMSGITVSRSD